MYIYLCADSGVLGLRNGCENIPEGFFFESGGLRSSIFVARSGAFAGLKPEIVDFCRLARRFRRSEV